MLLNPSKGQFQQRTKCQGINDQGPNYKSNNTIVDLQRRFLTEDEPSLMFQASDLIMLAYKTTSGSGVMFDALTHKLSFVTSDLDFFREFAEMGLGMIARRNAVSFAKAIGELVGSYDTFSKAVDNFKNQLKREFVTLQHVDIYNNALK